MKNYEIQAVLMKTLSLQNVFVTGNGNYFQVIAIGNVFNGMNRVKQQQIIYKSLAEYITDNRIHALSIKTYTPQEWESDRKLNGF